ncbi:MAG TPA: type VI secretion system contractile sheath small subunit [Bryobacteraceae bacterium]|jgi:type VI secretion system protein ImpB|nr:type VI secretion system contractile sheath small subunit [Bryobacteraceae bacterium]
MPESLQHKLDRVRPPRVQITYDVEIGGAILKKELPLVVGVLADLSGNPEQPLPKLRQRKFVEIDRDNFNDVLAACAPRVTLRVDNRLTKDAGSKLNVELKFKEIDDFTPLNVMSQVEPLSKLFAARQKLTDLLGKLDGNDALDSMLQEIVANTDELKKLQAATATEKNGNA